MNMWSDDVNIQLNYQSIIHRLLAVVFVNDPYFDRFKNRFGIEIPIRRKLHQIISGHSSDFHVT